MPKGVHKTMFITTRKTVSMLTGEVLEHEGYEYSGPVEHACGASSGENQIAQEQQQNFNTMSSEAQQTFGQSSQVFQDLNSAFAPVLAAGPGQSGFTPAELANLKSQAITNTGVATRNAQQAAGERASAAGGGTTVLPSGAALGMNANIAEAGAQQTASELSNINLENAQLGQQNWMNAAGVLSGATNTYNASTGVANATTGSGSSAMSGANTVEQANQQGINDVLGVVEAGAGAASSILCPAEGSVYLMADGSEKPVEFLAVGEQIAGIDDEPQTIEEIQSNYTNIIRVCTENGYSARNSPVHAFVLPKGGFVVAARSLGKTILTANGPSKVICVEPAGKAWVFNVITDGSHSYRADGVWALGVGDAERSIEMNEWAAIGDRMFKDKTKWAAGGR